MASIDKRPNGKWRARWREFPTGPQKTRVFARKADAERFLDHVRGELARGAYVDPNAGRVLFRDFAEQWRAGQIHRRSTEKQVESYFRLHVYPVLGNRPIASIRRSEIQAWVKSRTEVLSPGSVELAYRWVATVFTAAVDDRLIGVSPCVKISLPKRDHVEVDPLRVEEVEALAGALPARYRAIVLFAAGMGLRQGECLGLTVDRVDFLHRQVRVDRQLLEVVKGQPVFGPPKTRASVRTVPMPSVVTDLLAAHLARYPARSHGLVFTNVYGGPLRKGTLNTAWVTAREKLGLPRHVTFHDLRHFYASLLIAQGCSVKSVQRRLGHQSATETLDTYGHLWPDSDDETRDAVDGILMRLTATA